MNDREELQFLTQALGAHLELLAGSGAEGVPPGAATQVALQSVRTASPKAAVAEPAPPGVEKAEVRPAAPRAPQVAPRKPADEIQKRLDVMRGEVATCTKCVLHESRTKTVFSRGNPEAKLVFVGEAPGADEDAEGVPFVGRAGQLLDKMIAAMGLSPENDVYICNIIKCRPPENRKPTSDETRECIPYLEEQLTLVQPRVIVALGNTAVGTLLDTKMGITKIRGQWKLYKGQTLLMPTYHPSYLLRPSAQQASAKREAWEDLQAVMKELGLALPKKA